MLQGCAGDGLRRRVQERWEAEGSWRGTTGTAAAASGCATSAWTTTTAAATWKRNVGDREDRQPAETRTVPAAAAAAGRAAAAPAASCCCCWLSGTRLCSLGVSMTRRNCTFCVVGAPPLGVCGAVTTVMTTLILTRSSAFSLMHSRSPSHRLRAPEMRLRMITAVSAICSRTNSVNTDCSSSSRRPE